MSQTVLQEYGPILPFAGNADLLGSLLPAAGWARREISGRFFLSENTVKFHLKAVFRKLGIRSRKELKECLEKKGSCDSPSEA